MEDFVVDTWALTTAFVERLRYKCRGSLPGTLPADLPIYPPTYLLKKANTDIPASLGVPLLAPAKETQSVRHTSIVVVSRHSPELPHGRSSLFFESWDRKENLFRKTWTPEAELMRELETVYSGMQQ